MHSSILLPGISQWVCLRPSKANSQPCLTWRSLIIVWQRHSTAFDHKLCYNELPLRNSSASVGSALQSSWPKYTTSEKNTGVQKRGESIIELPLYSWPSCCDWTGGPNRVKTEPRVPIPKIRIHINIALRGRSQSLSAIASCPFSLWRLTLCCAKREFTVCEDDPWIVAQSVHGSAVCPGQSRDCPDPRTLCV